MTQSDSRRGFTLIEVLVASLLLGMLVSILTMVFNQSSIAWRTGKAGVTQLSMLRRQLARSQYVADNLVPRVSESGNVNGRVLSAWDMKGDLRKRAVGKFDKGDLRFTPPAFSTLENPESSDASWLELSGLRKMSFGSEKTFVVGVRSYGPDGKEGTEDDITSWPEDVE